MMKKLTLLLLAVTGLVLTGCASYPPVFYQQIYHLNGKRSDADKPYDVGVPLPVAEFRTELQKLYALYPDAVGKIPASSYNRRGWFFIQKDLQRTLGGGTGDLCNHAAWYVLNLVKDKKQQAEYAKKIAGFMRDFDDQGAMLLLEDFRKKLMPDGVILVHAQKQYGTVQRDPERKNKSPFRAQPDLLSQRDACHGYVLL